ncbi:hypothetical protein TNCT_648601 [Trichonephila clavata]|uniref:Reverse transcriptase domain-containing protein n=1 Tax=Trichonephila clavata TaxID=2740835 RepID=A0A8X6F701_TRICU|nr:hypothetical protein TNCT_648601 [Trichonephila clavata]
MDLGQAFHRDRFLAHSFFFLYMNTVDDDIVNEAKITCYYDDIAIWNSHTDISVSKNVLNENLSHIEDCAKQLKLRINLDKPNTVYFLLRGGIGPPFLPN